MSNKPSPAGSCSSCESCDEIDLEAIDPHTFLARLPASILKRNLPGDPGFGGTPIQTARVGEATLGSTPASEDASPQWDIARIVTEEEAWLLQGVRKSLALTYGLGILTEEGGTVRSQCPHATGTDLDKVIGQFGLQRPFGFTDCCYWRLFQVLYWMPTDHLGRLYDICLLYTGQYPVAVESPGVLTLMWFFNDAGERFLSSVSASPDGLLGGADVLDWDAYLNYNAYLKVAGSGQDSAPEYSGERTGDGYMSDLTTVTPPQSAIAALSSSAYLADRTQIPPGGGGPTLVQALELVKPAGIRILIPPSYYPSWTRGCWGTTASRSLVAGEWYLSTARDAPIT